MKKNETKTTANKVENKVTTLNFSDIAERLSKVEEKEVKRKLRLYIYPENFTEKMINEKEGKQFRSKQRNVVNTFSKSINVYAKHNKIDELKKEVKNFVEYYKKTFRLNDFTITSISQKEDSKTEDWKLMLDIVKKVIAS